ncbi:cation-dependent mannose-6-phosphate receptor-like [Mytilus californianus]|uniref:cation-dependent mannose-6-phosphate receptor-like n=1 Tax=Mytilus californianus TaxID=6549 RepID=UPI0022470706|nr:cation-dependent mannose-6-phosphate receptor-like [Mytilus californianus]XP_052096027.1 cation-dependent mannose-6-phosphate receptor-like [Mytilus californianus]
MEAVINLSVCILAFISVLSDVINAESCTQINSCSCRTESSNFVFNLKPLSQPNNPSLVATDSKGGYKYIYNPCDPMTVCKTGGGEKDIAVCQQSIGTTTTYYCAGKESGSIFQGDLQAGSLSMKFQCTADDAQKTIRTTTIQVVCGDGNTLEFVKDSSPKPPKPQPEGIYVLKLTTQHACVKGGSGGLSTGSVILLIFFILLIIYLVGGILFMKFMRGASGIEMVPNLELWKGLPSLIKDGFVFVSKGCKANTTYSQI